MFFVPLSKLPLQTSRSVRENFVFNTFVGFYILARGYFGPFRLCIWILRAGAWHNTW